ncbi:MAG: hypothetical protein ABR501_00135 [Pyrinomonadaceae bacterium]
MHKPANQLSTITLAITCALLCFSGASAQTNTALAGSWQTKGPDPGVHLTLNADGTGVLDRTPIKYRIRDTQLTVDEEGTINNYTFKITGDELVISGGDLDRPMTFIRQRPGKGFGGRQTQSSVGSRDGQQSSEAVTTDIGLVGHWQSSEATAQIRDDGTLVLNGQSFKYAVKGNKIMLANDEGAADFPFQLSGDTLRVLVDGRTVVYKRVKAGDNEGTFNAPSGANPAELFGKWCYMSNVNSNSGGRMSNRCFALYGNGTYEYYSETSSSGPYGGTASQESDSGTWTATATTITRNSRSLGTETYSLEKRNHPKNGDPMLIIDGDAYVTATARSPWP